MGSTLPNWLQARLETLRVLVVDDDHHMRKVIRTMLAAIGVRTVYEACDGKAGLDVIRSSAPDIVIVDWEMPTMNGADFVRFVRSPGQFPLPDVPIIVLSGHGERWRVIEAARVGAHEYLLKPVSLMGLRDRIAAVLCKPRPSVKLEDYYGPLPRRPSVLISH